MNIILGGLKRKDVDKVSSSQFQNFRCLNWKWEMNWPLWWRCSTESRRLVGQRNWPCSQGEAKSTLSLRLSWQKLCHHHPCPLQLLQFQHHLCQPLLQQCNQHLVSESEARLREGRQRLEQLSTRLPWQAFLMLQQVEMLHHLLLLSPLLLHQGLHSDDLFASSFPPQMDVAGSCLWVGERCLPSPSSTWTETPHPHHRSTLGFHAWTIVTYQMTIVMIATDASRYV